MLSKIKTLHKIKFVQDVAILQMGSMVGTGLSMLASIVFARVLGPSLYGTYSLIFALVGLVGIFMDWGVGYGALTLMAEAYAKKDVREVKNIVIYFLKISFYSTVVLGSIATILAPWIAKLSYGEPHIGYLARWVILASVVRVFYSLLITILQVLRKMKYLTVLENINKAFYTLIPVGLVMLGMGVMGIVLGHFITAIIFLCFSVVVYVVLTKRNSLFPNLTEIAANFFKVKVKKYFIFGFTVAVDKNLGNLYTILPMLIAGAYVPTEQIAFFKIATGLVGMSAILLNPIARLLNVQLPQSKAQSFVNLKKAFFRSSFGSFLISVVMALGVVILAKPLIVIFYGSEFSGSVSFVYLLSVSLLISGCSVGLGSLFRTLDKMKVTIFLNSTLIVVGLPFLYLSIKHYGVWGLATAYVVWPGVANILALWIVSKFLNQETIKEQYEQDGDRIQ